METIDLNLESLFEEHKNLINRTIRRNRSLLSALRLEDEDVAQQLSIAMLSAIRRFDPDRSESLATYIWYSLQYEVLNIKRLYKPHGVTGVPKGYRLGFLYLDNVLPNGCAYELPSGDDMSGLEFSELFYSLSEPEAEALDLKVRGYPVRRKAQTAAMDRVRHRYTELYAVNC